MPDNLSSAIPSYIPEFFVHLPSKQVQVKEENTYSLAKQIFTEYLEANRCRKTVERYAILERVYAYRTHFDAETLFNDMKDNFRVSLATVYNTLELLLKCKLVVKHQFGNQPAQYEKACNNNVHQHLICTNCGKISEFTDKRIKEAILAKKFPNFQAAQYSLYVYGRCKKCRRK